MKKYLLTLMALLGLTIISCNDDEEGCYPPTYQGFRYEPSVIHAGDSVTITAVQQLKGHRLNATDYNWKLTIQVNNNGVSESKELTYKEHTNYNGLSDADPVWGVRLPANTEPGIYTCTFSAQFSNSADGDGGMYNGGTGEGCTGTINSYSYTLYSNANGSFRLRVQ